MFWNDTSRARRDGKDGPSDSYAGLQTGVSAVLYPPTEHRQPVCHGQLTTSSEDCGGSLRAGAGSEARH